MQKAKSTITRDVEVARRLNALIEEALAPLSALNDSNQQHFLLSDSPSTLDCHALSLLGLALMPCLENPFLASAFTTQFKGLEEYTRRSVKEAFGPPVTASDALVRAPVMEVEEDEGVEFGEYGNEDVGSGRAELPWRRARTRGMNQTMRGMARLMAS